MRPLDNQYEGLFLGDDKGELFAGVTASGDTPYNGMSIADTPWFSSTRENGNISISDVLVSPITGNAIITICAPVFDKRNQFAAVFGMEMRLDAIGQMVSKTCVGKSGYAFMTDHQGRILAHPDADLELTLNTKTIPGMEKITRAMLAGETDVLDYVFKLNDKVAGFAPVKMKQWSVAVTQEKEAFMAVAQDIRDGNLIFGGVFMTFSLIIAFFFGSHHIRTRQTDGNADSRGSRSHCHGLQGV